MKGLSEEQYDALMQLERLNGFGLPVWEAQTANAKSLVVRGLIGVEPRTCVCCGTTYEGCLAVSPLGRTAMRCYELEHRSVDLGATS